MVRRFLLVAAVARSAFADPVTILTAPPLTVDCERLLELSSPTVDDAKALLRCFEPTDATTTSLEVTETHVAAGERFFVTFPRAFEQQGRSAPFSFLSAPLERQRAISLLHQFLRWRELDERPVSERPNGRAAPFVALAPTCDELDGYRPASRTALEVLVTLRQAAGCAKGWTHEQQRAALNGSTEAMAHVCTQLGDDELQSSPMLSAMLRAAHFDPGTSECIAREDGGNGCARKERRFPGAAACLARLGVRHAVAITDVLLADGTTITFDYLGRPKAVFTIATDVDGTPVRGIVSASARGASLPPDVKRAMQPASKLVPLVLRETAHDGGVRTFVARQPHGSPHTSVVVVDLDGTVSVSAPR